MSTVISSKNQRNRKVSRKLLINKTWLVMAPSLLFLVIIFILSLALIVVPDEVNRRTQYELETYRAMGAGDFQRARNCLESLIQLSSDNPRQEYLYQLAILSQQVGDGERAFRLLQRLTSPDQPGYIPAHKNLADLFLSQQQPTESSMSEAERHIQALLAQRPDDPVYLQMLARLQLQRDQREDALKTFGLVLERDASVGIPMGQILLSLKRDAEAKTIINRTKERLQTQLDQNYENTTIRLQLADANLLLNDYPQAARILQSGIALGDPNNQFRRAMSVVLARWSASLSNSIEDLSRRISLLLQGLVLEPTNPLLLGQFWKLAIKDLGSDPNQILKLRVLGANASLLETMSGLQSLQAGKTDEAEKSLESAIKKSPDLLVLLNNLSTIGELQNESNSDLSMNLISILIKIAPDNANLKENRGMIYMRKNKFDEAVKDLEFALTGTANQKSIQAALSEAYSKLGNSEKANFYKILAEKDTKPKIANKEDEENATGAAN